MPDARAQYSKFFGNLLATATSKVISLCMSGDKLFRDELVERQPDFILAKISRCVDDLERAACWRIIAARVGACRVATAAPLRRPRELGYAFLATPVAVGPAEECIMAALAVDPLAEIVKSIEKSAEQFPLLHCAGARYADESRSIFIEKRADKGQPQYSGVLAREWLDILGENPGTGQQRWTLQISWLTINGLDYEVALFDATGVVDRDTYWSLKNNPTHESDPIIKAVEEFGVLSRQIKKWMAQHAPSPWRERAGKRLWQLGEEYDVAASRTAVRNERSDMDHWLTFLYELVPSEPEQLDDLLIFRLGNAFDASANAIEIMCRALSEPRVEPLPSGSRPLPEYSRQLVGNAITLPTDPLSLEQIAVAIWGHATRNDQKRLKAKKRCALDWMHRRKLPANRDGRGKYVVSKPTLEQLSKIEGGALHT